MSGNAVRRITRCGKRSGHQILHTGESLAVDALNWMRRGEPTVLMTPPTGLRFGNLLYVWLQAHRRTRAGAPTLALEARAMEPWLIAFPELASLTMPLHSLPFRARREWDRAWLYQRFGTDFTSDDVTAFVRETLAPHVAPDHTGTLVVNVRRGDYYTEHAGKYAFDQIEFLQAAFKTLTPAGRILVVSDDADWCRANLTSVIPLSAAEVEYAAPDPLANFLAVAGAARIIGTNSTFTYWAAYVAGVLNPNAQVVMPRFHARMAHGTAAHQLDPRWTVLDGFH